MIALAIVLVLNYFGVRLAIRAMLTFALVSFVPMLILALVIIAKGGENGNTLTMFDPGQTSLFGITGGGVLGGILLGILLFVGFEAAASIGEESEDPHRSIPRALIGTVAVGGRVLRLHVVRLLDRLRQEGRQRGRLGVLAERRQRHGDEVRRHWYATLLEIVVILDAMALALAICVMIGRGFFALGRDGLLPSFFAKTSRRDTPWVGNLMVAVGGIGLVLLVFATNYASQFGFVGPDGKFVPFFPNDQFATFILSATIGSFAIELVYLVLAVAAFGLVRSSGNKWWQYLIVAGGRRDADPRLLRRAQPGAARQLELQLGRRGLDDRPARRRARLVRDRRRHAPRQGRQRSSARRRAPRRRAARRDARLRAGRRDDTAVEESDDERAHLARRRRGGGGSAVGFLRRVEVEGAAVCLGRTADGWVAFQDTCTHEECSLADGELEGGVIVCPCHASEFDLRTGDVLCPPALEPLPIFEARVEAGELQVRLAPPPAAAEAVHEREDHVSETVARAATTAGPSRRRASCSTTSTSPTSTSGSRACRTSG